MSPRADSPCEDHRDHRLIQQVTGTIEQFAMFTPGDKVLAGVSGGVDSVALLFILFDLSKELQISLGAAYLNHGLRPQEAQQESIFVLGLADRLGICGHAGKVDLGVGKGSLEERARNARYRFLAKTKQAHGYTKIALAHHADDNAELVLMRLLRGSGSRGLAGIPPVRSGGIVRPLLAVRKSELHDYLRRRSLPHMEDASNNDPRFFRNRIRHRLLPLLEREYNPNIVATLNRSAVFFREEEAWVQSLIAPLVRNLITRQASGQIELEAELLRAQPRPVQRRLLRAALQLWRGSLKGIGAEHVDCLLAMISRTNRRRGGLCLPGGIYALLTGSSLRLTLAGLPRGKFVPAAGTAFSYKIDRPGSTPLVVDVAETDYRLTFSLYTSMPAEELSHKAELVAWFDADQLIFPLQVRNFQKGDRLRPQGMQGSQKLQDLFVNRKIARHLRTRLPLLLSQNSIIWVVGVRRSVHALVSGNTTHWLRVEAANRTLPVSPADRCS